MSDTLIVPFPLYHGTSSHYRDMFRPGEPVAPWPHKGDALALFRATWEALARRGEQPEWWQQRMLDQATGASNWRHGTLYAVPGRREAGAYAGSNGWFGGELLKECADNLERLGDYQAGDEADAIRERFPALSPMLAGGGRPLIVVLRDVPVRALKAETDGGEWGVPELIADIGGRLDDEATMATYGGLGFAVPDGVGIVDRVEEA